MPIKLKPKAGKDGSQAPKTTTKQKQEEARKKAEEEARAEASRIEYELQEAERKQREWEARPGPVPIGWGSSLGCSCVNEGSWMVEYYWRDNDPRGSVTWDRPAVSGEIQQQDLMVSLKTKNDAFFCMQKAQALRPGEKRQKYSVIYNKDETISIEGVAQKGSYLVQEEYPGCNPNVKFIKTEAKNRAGATWTTLRTLENMYLTEDENNSQITFTKESSQSMKVVFHDQIEAAVEDVRRRHRLPRGGEWQLCMQLIFPKEETDEVCNLERPGFKDSIQLVAALTLLKYFLWGPCKHLQDLLAATRHLPHEKLPPHLHYKSVLNRIVDLLYDSRTDVQQAAANLIAAACTGAHRSCQDLLVSDALARQAMLAKLVEMLQNKQTIQAACMAMGMLCTNSHKANQDALSAVPSAAEELLELLEEDDTNNEHAVHFAIFHAAAGASKPTRTYWERSRGYCMSLSAPKKPVNQWREAVCHRSSVAEIKATMNLDRNQKAIANLAARKADYQTHGEKALAMLLAAPEPEDVPWNKIAKQKGKESNLMHIPVALTQDPAHAHLHLATKRANVRQREHEIHHEMRITSKGSTASTPNLRGALLDASAGSDSSLMKSFAIEIAPALRALADRDPNDELSFGKEDSFGKRPSSKEKSSHYSKEEQRLHIADCGTLATIDSPRSFASELEREIEDHDLHHLDPALDDGSLCRVGKELRHAAPTGFLRPLNSNQRYGMCT